jgi:16S rRNA processing protein RimM
VDNTSVLIGTIAAPFGVRGEVKVMAHFARMPLIKSFKSLELVSPDGVGAQVKVVSVRHHPPSWLVLLDGIDRNQAEHLHGYTLRALKTELPPLPEDEFYAFDIEGCQVVTDAGRDFGVVHTVHVNANSNDVYETDVAMIPAVEHFVLAVDIAQKVITVRDVPGLRVDEL